jgi:hypothetical protein
MGGAVTTEDIERVIVAAGTAHGLSVSARVAALARYCRGREQYGASGDDSITAPGFDGLAHAREEALDAHNYLCAAVAHGQLDLRDDRTGELLAANAAVLRLIAEVRQQ